MASKNIKKESFNLKDKGKGEICQEEDEEINSEFERKEEDIKNLEEMDIENEMDDSFSESFYKEILEDSDNEQKNFKKNNLKEIKEESNQIKNSKSNFYLLINLINSIIK